MSKSDDLTTLMHRAEFPRSQAYDPAWVIEHRMGLNALWLTEWLCQHLDLQPGMRVLDLGCGKALSSIFLAREFGVQVWATDLWIGAAENLQRIDDFGLGDTVFPIHADARQLPFAEGYFDAILAIDSYIYFGTDDLYLNYIQRFLRPAGQIGIVLNCFTQELRGALPDHLKPFWAQECWTWHTIDWWRQHWERTGLVDIGVADTLEDGCAIWLQFNRARWAMGNRSAELKTDIEVMGADGGAYMGWARMIAQKAPSQ
ncbi:MAG: methyltransferase domain-containing protein [Candidatus Latescibacteria bacterium]|nr:methyltransferase domain-containing protein [Candidatus Latescibacterota bacterium]